MRRLSLLAALALVLSACGTEGPVVTPGSSGRDELRPPETTVTNTGLDEAKAKPPRIWLESAGGSQAAEPGSSCVSFTNQQTGEGVAVCGDTPDVHPREQTVVRPGDPVRFVLGGEVVRADGCHAEDPQSCVGEVLVKPLGCHGPVVDRIPLAFGSNTTWTVDLDPGSYELDYFANFETNDGRTGDVSGSLGLLVDPSESPDVEPLPLDAAVC
jgi:hypothetical protein